MSRLLLLLPLLVACPADDDDDSAPPTDDDDATVADDDDDSAVADDDDSGAADDDDSTPIPPPAYADVDAAFFTITGGIELGANAASAGDIDGDGLGDLVVGQPEDPWVDDAKATGFGAVYVFLGATLAAGGDFTLEDADVVVRGDSPGQAIGNNVGTAGDVDGNGDADLLISAGNTENTFVFFDSLLVPGAELRGADASANITDFVSQAADTAGDVDNDGFADVLVGNTLVAPNGFVSGQTYLMAGSLLATGGAHSVSAAWARFPGEATNNASGDDVGAIGDIDNDGLADFAIAATGNSDSGANAGKAYIFLGASVSATSGMIPLASADATLLGAAPDDRLGTRFSVLGDLDEDGHDDFAIGGPHNDDNGNNAGAIWLMSGAEVAAGTAVLSAPLWQLVGPDASQAGRVIAPAGDVDGDGLPDLVAGSSRANGAAVFRVAEAVESPVLMDEVLGLVRGLEDDDDLGASALTLGDLDGDGRDDLVVGAPGVNVGAGAVYGLLSPFVD